MKQHKQNYFKVRWGIFSFFSSTNVETKNVCPVAYNDGHMKSRRLRAEKLSHVTNFERAKPLKLST